MFELNDALTKAGLDPTKVLLMRHRPTEPALRKALPWLAAEQPNLYNAYQQSHGEAVERALEDVTHIASFIGHEAGRALFVGIYEVGAWRDVTHDEFWAMECNRELRLLGTRGPKEERISRWYDLPITSTLADWKGRLVVEWKNERSWWRWAARNVMPVAAIHDESVLVRPMPKWSDLVLTWTELQTLPRSWQGAMGQWRGVYVILDRASGKHYVGSAYGDENVLSRWLAYAKTGHGGNVDLKGRDPAGFQFALLELVAPGSPPDAVIEIETSWKIRLGTREFGLNQN